MSRRALLLVGSPKPVGSISESLGSCLLERLAARGFATDVASIHAALACDGSVDALLATIDGCDLVVVSSPVYIGSLPAPVIKAFELVADHRRRVPPPAPQRLAAIANCGFPETIHTEVSLAVCRLFARDAGFIWMGGLALAGAAAAEGRPAEQRGTTRNVVRALALAGDALAGDEPIPPEAAALMARPAVPSWLYRLIGNLSWRRLARREGIGAKLGDRPYRA